MKILDKLFNKKTTTIVLCEWISCANNRKGVCQKECVSLNSKRINGKEFQECTGFDWE